MQRLSSRRLCLILLLTGIALRLFRFNFQSLWYDEVFSVVFAGAPTLDQLLATLRGDFHPPLYFVTLRGWLSLFGQSDQAARFLSVSIGVGGLLLMWALLCDCALRTSRATAIFLASTSLTLIWYAHEVRQYGLLFLAGTAALHSTVRLFRNARLSILYCAVSYAALLYTHYAGLLAIGAAWVAVIFVCVYSWNELPNRQSALRALGRLALAHSAAALCFLPWLPTFLAQRANAQHALWIPTPTIQTLLEVIPRLMAYRLPWDSSRYNWWLLAILLPLSYLFLTFLSRNEPENAGTTDRYAQLSLRVFIASWITVPIFTAYALSLSGTKIFYFRNLIFVLPAIVIALAALSSVSRWGRGVVAFIIASSLANLPWYYGSRHKEDWRRTVPFITERVTESTAALFDVPGTRLAYDYYAHGVSLPEYNADSTPKPNRLFYIRALSGTKLDTVIERLRNDGYSLTKRRNFPGIVVIVFDRQTRE
jgi:uncharacterized membrane protein